MKKKYFEKFCLVSLLLLFVFLMLPVCSLADGPEYAYSTEWPSPFVDFELRIECITVPDGIDYKDPEIIDSRWIDTNYFEDDYPLDFNEEVGSTYSKTLKLGGNGEINDVWIMSKTQVNIEGEFSKIDNYNLSFTRHPILKTHKSAFYEETRRVVIEKFKTYEKQQIRYAGSDTWEPFDDLGFVESSIEHVFTVKALVPRDLQCEPDRFATPKRRSDGTKYYPCKVEGCKKKDPETQKRFLVVDHNDHTYMGQSCTKKGECICGKWGEVLGHDPDYKNGIEYSEDEIRYPCKREGCNEIAEYHRHTFKDTGEKTPTNECVEISGDSQNHKRKYMYQRQCTNGEHCKMLRDFPKWEVESHSWHNEVVKPATCTEDGSRTRMCSGCDYVDVSVLQSPGHIWLDGPVVSSQNFKLDKFIMSLFLGNAHADTGYNDNVLQHCSVCKKTNCEVYRHSWTPATCKSPKTCSRCQVTEGSKLSHVPDYDNGIEYSADEVRYPCKNSGCNEIAEYHRHTFKDTGKKTPTDECIEISGDSQSHKRKYMYQRQCNNGEHCKILRDFPKWEVESHSWHNEVVKPATCTKDGSKTRMCAGCDYVDTTVLKAPGGHDPDYDHPQVVSDDEIRYPCKRSGCKEIAEFHRHTFTNDGTPKPQNEYLKITGDNENHKRKYLQPRKCTGAHCSITRDFDTWVVESHTSWRTTETKSATCYQNGYEKKACNACGFEKTITKKATGDHVYDYSNPESVAYNVVIYHCKTPGCGAYKDHTHAFEKNGSEVKTSTLRKSTTSLHQRKYTQALKCSCGKTSSSETWKDENHSFANDGSEVKTSTLRKSTASLHQRKYTQAKKCACGETTTSERWADETHSFANNGSEVKTSTLRKSTASLHQRKYTQAKKCACGETTTSERWADESHSFANNGSEVKTSTLRKSTDSLHQRKYTQAKKCTCGETTTSERWADESHSFTNNGTATPTDSYSQISGNTSQHKRLYKQPQKCACSQTKTATEWRNESHSWVQKGETHGNCVTPTIKGYQCSKCSMTKSENGAKDPNNHAALATRYTTVTAANCVRAGSGYYPCSACGGKVNVTIPKNGVHNMGSWQLVETPTATSKGKLKRKCLNSGCSYYETKPAR